MRKITRREITLGAGGLLLACTAPAEKSRSFEVTYTEKEWRERLTPEQFRVLRKHGTEPAGSSPLNDIKEPGTFVCAGCGQPLFKTATKFDSGTGWPSFWAPLPHHIGTSVDTKLAMTRTEYHCRRCGGHQGHVFSDGPAPTGLRYCNNGLALRFIPEENDLPALRG